MKMRGGREGGGGGGGGGEGGGDINKVGVDILALHDCID